MTILSNDEIKVYSRHLTLPEVGISGQERLKKSSVLLVGVGGLGSPCSMYLAAAGVGRLGIIDNDIVDRSNLHRQVIHGHSTLGLKKVLSGKNRLHDINPYIEILTYDEKLNTKNALNIFNNFDIIIDGTDNFPSRYLINDAAFFSQKPYVFGSIFRFDGQITVFNGKSGPCYRCLFPTPPRAGSVPSCAEGGVLGVLPGIVGSIQAAEAIKIILGLGNSLLGKLLTFDVLSMNFDKIKVNKDSECSLCGQNPTIKNLIDYEEACGFYSPGQAVYDDANNATLEISAVELSNLISSQDPFLIDVRSSHEWEIAHIAGAILMPLATLKSRLNEIPKDREVVVYCKSGARSKTALNILQTAGFNNLKNLKGGILSWCSEVDPSLPHY